MKSDGSVVSVGDNSYGQRNVNKWTDIVAISAGANHTVGLMMAQLSQLEIISMTNVISSFGLVGLIS